MKRKSGFIDKSGKVVVEPKFDMVSEFTNGLSFVAIKNEKKELFLGYIDKKGKYVWKPTK